MLVVELESLIGLLFLRDIGGKCCWLADILWLVFFGRTLCHLMEKLRPKMENTFAIYFWFLCVFINIKSS